MKEKCDICGKETNDLVDYYALLCPSCRQHHTDIVLLQKIGFLLNKLEDLKNENSRTLKV